MSREKLIDVKEVARRLGLSVKTVYTWAEDGRLECVKLGDSPQAPLRFKESYIDRLIDGSGRED